MKKGHLFRRHFTPLSGLQKKLVTELALHPKNTLSPSAALQQGLY